MPRGGHEDEKKDIADADIGEINAQNVTIQVGAFRITDLVEYHDSHACKRDDYGQGVSVVFYFFDYIQYEEFNILDDFNLPYQFYPIQSREKFVCSIFLDAARLDPR